MKKQVIITILIGLLMILCFNIAGTLIFNLVDKVIIKI
jgi:hypothetical protein